MIANQGGQAGARRRAAWGGEAECVSQARGEEQAGVAGMAIVVAVAAPASARANLATGALGEALWHFAAVAAILPIPPPPAR